jgi:hypothetical protein
MLLISKQNQRRFRLLPRNWVRQCIKHSRKNLLTTLLPILPRKKVKMLLTPILKKSMKTTRNPPNFETC